MKKSYLARVAPVLILLLALAAAPSAGPKPPITGDKFKALIKAQDVRFQHHLEEVFSEAEGYQVTGPLDLFYTGGPAAQELYRSLRVIVPDLDALDGVLDRLKNDSALTVERWIEHIHQGRPDVTPGYRGVLADVVWNGTPRLVQFMTVQQTRWLIWAEDILARGDPTLPDMPLDAYCREVSDHLYAVERGWDDIPTRTAVDFGLLDTLDFYREPPDYVIEGYQNYKDFMTAHAAIETDFAHGILAFRPTDSLMEAFRKSAPKTAWPNKEFRMLQHEYRTFFERGGDTDVMQTLTPEGFDTLKAGEYFFALSVSGKIRFGRELMREEVAAIEEETGRKVPRANHAYLFPGEPVLTAGAFYIVRDSLPRLTEVTAGSGHYFYSNLTKTIREDIAERSDTYLFTLGHFFNALDRLEIPYDGVLIRKF